LLTDEHPLGKEFFAGPAPIDGAAILDSVAAFIRRFVVVSNSQKIVLALWEAHTHCFDAAVCTPYLSITSAEKESGKSRLLDVLALLAANPWRTGGVTKAVLVRKIERDRPTLFLDETDPAFNGDKEFAEALRGVLNNGYCQGGVYSCCVPHGKEIELKDFSVFCPKALAGIGKLPDTVASRSIPIRMKRAARGETYERYRRREVLPEAGSLFGKLFQWCKSLDLVDARPALPDELSDRQWDVVEPLLAIADAAGGEWPAMARHALVELCSEGRVQDDSIGMQVLRDIRQVFIDKDVDRISSNELAEALVGIETSPWAEWSNGKPISKAKLARLLGKFGITPGNIRQPDGKVPKGYHRDDFTDSWERYLPQDTPQSPSTPLSKGYNATTRINTSDSADFDSATGQERSGSENGENPNKNAPCSVVALSGQGDGGGEGYQPDASGPGCTCLECGLHFGTVAGWRAHLGRCARAKAAD
jgi:hypothetical protein